MHGDVWPGVQRQRRARRLADFFWPRVGRLNVVWSLIHNTNEAKPLAWNGPDQLLVRAAIADGLSRGVDAARECRVRHDSAAPNRSDEIFFADDAVAVLHQIDQQIEHLRLHGNCCAAAEQLAAFCIKRMIVKDKMHVAPRTASVLKE